MNARAAFTVLSQNALQGVVRSADLLAIYEAAHTVAVRLDLADEVTAAAAVIQSLRESDRAQLEFRDLLNGKDGAK